MRSILPLIQGSPEWLAFRRTRIGASDIAAVMGLSPYKTPLQLWTEKIEGTQIADNDDMARGRDLEPFIRRMVSEHRHVHYEPVCLANSRYNLGFASLDGWDENAEIKILECKAPRKNPMEIPFHYLAQVQWQMMIADVSEAIYASYDGEELMETIIKADPLLWSKMQSAAIEFFDRLLNFDPPPPTDKDLVEISDPEAFKLASDIAGANEKIKILEGFIEDWKKELRMLAKDRSMRIGADYRFVKYTRKGAVEYAAIPELQDVDLNKYRKKPIEGWRFT